MSKRVKDSKGNALSVGDKVAVNVIGRTSGGFPTNNRRIVFGKVVGFNPNSAQVITPELTFIPAVKPRAIRKVDNHNQPNRSRTVFMPLGVNIVEARIVNTTPTSYNLVYNRKDFQFRKHMVVKV